MSEDKITEIYVTIDDFNQLFEKELRLASSSAKKRNRQSKLLILKIRNKKRNPTAAFLNFKLIR
ncbi:hypothetical protein GO491_03465 [Flavobacteriaceae bacterium Ap0902]|nr:hypothetical protein [Flavobacteriaceae bacterium Ap0902]